MTIQVIVGSGDRLIAVHDAEQKIDMAAYQADDASARNFWIDDASVVDGEPWALADDWRTANLPALVKTECSHRINLVLKDSTTQINMTALGTRLTRKEATSTLDAGETATLDLLEAAQAWVAAMQGKARDLALAGDLTFDDDAHWPAAPAGLSDLVALL